MTRCLLARVACVAAVAALLSPDGTAGAQEISVAVALDAISYGGDAYEATEEHPGGEVAVGYELSRVRPLVGARVAWEHQRVGDQSDGFWAYGWGAGGVGGLLVRLGEPVSVGVRTVVSGLNLERGNDTSRNGVRFQLGGTFVLTWPVR